MVGLAYSLLALLAASQVSAHATFQDLWVEGVDQGATCARLPPSNSPVQSPTSADIRCNVGGTSGKAGKCSVAAGGRVTIEMHQQNGDRSCTNEAIGGAHYGPVLVYLSSVSDSSTSDGSGSWFKIFQDTWAKGGSVGDNDYWGTKDLNTCCGKMDVHIPSNIPSGDYLLRAEVIALHAAQPSGGAQFYMTCFQLTVTGGSGSVPAGVKFPGAYAQSDPGIGINIHQALSTYIPPGPTVIAGGSTKSAGDPSCPVTGGAAPPKTTTASVAAPKTTTSAAPEYTTTATTSTTLRTTVYTSTAKTTTTAIATTSPPPSGGATCAQYQQCGGTGWTGCTTCSSGWTCKVLNAYYSQCTQ